MRPARASLILRLRSIAVFSALVIAAPTALGDCFDPNGATGVAGQFRYMSDYKEFRHCDGTYWQSMATRTSIGTSCTAGTMTVTSGDLRMCNGTNWLSMTGAIAGVCTVSTGATTYDVASRQMRFCNGTNNRTVGLQPSDAVAIVSSGTPYVHVYNSPAGSLRAAPTTPTAAPYGSIAYSPTGSHLVLGLMTSPFIFLYDVNASMARVIPEAIPESAMSFSFNASGTRLAVGLWAPPYFTVYDTATWTRLVSANVPDALGPAWSVSYHPNGNLIAVLNDGDPGTPKLIFYDTTTLPFTRPTPIATADLPPGIGEAVAFSPNGRYLAVGLDTSPYLIVYRTSDWQKVPVTGGPQSLVHSLVWHPDSSKFVIGQQSTNAGSPYLLMVNAATWTTSAPFSDQPGEILGLSFNSRGTLLGVGFRSSTGPQFATYETYNWVRQSNVLTNPAVHSSDRAVYGVTFRPGQ